MATQRIRFSNSQFRVPPCFGNRNLLTSEKLAKGHRVLKQEEWRTGHPGNLKPEGRSPISSKEDPVFSWTFQYVMRDGGFISENPTKSRRGWLWHFRLCAREALTSVTSITGGFRPAVKGAGASRQTLSDPMSDWWMRYLGLCQNARASWAWSLSRLEHGLHHLLTLEVRSWAHPLCPSQARVSPLTLEDGCVQRAARLRPRAHMPWFARGHRSGAGLRVRSWVLINYHWCPPLPRPALGIASLAWVLMLL